jgi:hypothetical protein
MMCNGAVPPAVILSMEAYHLYMNLMINYWQFWSKVSGWEVYQESLQANNKP